MSDTDHLKIRPYARLLTMLGDQLIKNERIALMELIKNSYDADSPWVKVSFNGFGSGYSTSNESKIVIEDAGSGMSEEIIKEHWLNPATPQKKLQKREEKSYTPKGRIIQGEKGIGRFALLKIGKVITVITKPLDSDLEYIVEYDFSMFDEDFIKESANGAEPLFLDELSVKFSSREPKVFAEQEITLGTKRVNRPACGTKIIISDLKGRWSKAKLENLSRDTTRLQSIFYNPEEDDDEVFGGEIMGSDKFEVFYYVNEEYERFGVSQSDELRNLLDNSSVLKITKGEFDQDNAEFRFLLNSKAVILKLDDPVLKGLKIFERSDGFSSFGEYLNNRTIDCGSFKFSFYVFDFTPQARPKFILDKHDKAIIRDHRVYLYRDGIRVYPYGEPDDDWLRIDSYRGTISAGQFLSNDQVVGHINITQADNPNLKDKTNREGLIDEGYATESFITLIKLFLAYIRSKPYARYRQDLIKQRDIELIRANIIENELDELIVFFKDDKSVVDKSEMHKKLKAIKKAYSVEKRFLTQRAETVEDLAGVGLSVETAAHDVNAMMSSALRGIKGIINDLLSGDFMSLDLDELIKEMVSLNEALEFIEAKLKDIQLLFKSTKQRRKKIRIMDILEKILRIYKRILDEKGISCVINPSSSSLVATTTDAVLLQLLLNLFDNSIYWLKQSSVPDKRIQITLNEQDGYMVFSDNGPGVEPDDVPYIFESFYSGKGEEGRGLGLYIARQLLSRHDFSIDIMENESNETLSGANFIINFVKEE